MMRLPKFKYLAPRTISDAAKMLHDGGPEAMVVAGGTDLYPNMKRRQQTPKTVIGLRALSELQTVTGTPRKGVTLGAGLTLTQLCSLPVLQGAYPSLVRAIKTISTPILRNMGTLGGNLCLDTRCNYYDQTYEWRKAINFCLKKDGDTCWVARSSPTCLAVSSADTPPLLMAMDAEVTLQSSRGKRRIPLEKLYTPDGMNYLAKKRDEIVTSLHLPPVNGWKSTYWKLRRREAFDFPVLGVAAWMECDESRVCRDLRIVVGGVSPAPVRLTRAEEVLKGHRVTEDMIRQAAEAAFASSKPLDNTDFHMHWRKHMARQYVAGALHEVSNQLPVTRNQ